MTTTVTETPHVWLNQPPFFHVTCDRCDRTMSFRHKATAEKYADRHDREHAVSVADAPPDPFRSLGYP